MATRRKLDDALDYGRQLQSVHELQAAGANAAPEDIVAILDVSEVDADAQPKKITLQELVNAGGGGAGAAAAGSANQIQYNDGLSPAGLAASADLTWDDTGKVLGIGGDIDLDDGGTYATTLQVITPTANRTISFPDATGTLALVAGSSGQLIYNNAGANAGTSTLTYDGSILTSTGRFINSYNAAGIASAPAKAFTGTWFTGGTATTTKPHVLIEPSGTTSGAWNTSGTGFGVNAASGFTGNLLDLQVNGTSRAVIKSAGNIQALVDGSAADPSVRVGTSPHGFYQTGGSSIGVAVNSSLSFQLSTAGSTPGVRILSDTLGLVLGATGDTYLARDAAGIFAQRNGTNAQTYRLYNTYTDASNYERLSTTWSSNVCYTKPENAGTGSARIYVPVTGATTVASLPAAATAGAGARAFVTDATATTFLSTVAGGGANKVPVVSDGTNWLIG